METDAKIYVAGSGTFIGGAIRRELEQRGYKNIIADPVAEPQLTDTVQVDAFFEAAAPEYVFLAAGESGGIAANQKYPARLMLDNLLVECNVINSAHRHGVKKLLYLASSCVYPKACPQPMKEDYLLTGRLEPTNEAYAVAKIAGIKLCQAYNQQFGTNFISGIPANIYGPGDDFSQQDSHVIPGLIRRMQQAKVWGHEWVEIWGSGAPRREFIFVDDLADACIFVMNAFDGEAPINLGCGSDMSIRELAAQIKEAVGFTGELSYDSTRPDGMLLKSLDSSHLAEMGWRHRTSFQDGLAATYSWFLQTQLEESIANVL